MPDVAVPYPSDRIFMYAPELRRWIAARDGIGLPQRTLAGWLASGLVRASLRWTDGRPKRSGWKARGPGNACRFTVDDCARVRLVARLRYQLRLSPEDTRYVLRVLDSELDTLLRERTDARLVVDLKRNKVLVRRPGEPDYDVCGDSYVVTLWDVIAGNEGAALACMSRRTAA